MTLFKRWADDYVRRIHEKTTTHVQGPDPASGFLGLCPEAPEPPPLPEEVREELADATPREHKTVGQLTLDDRGTLVEVKSMGLTVRGILQDLHAEAVTEWENYGGAPHILPGPVTLDIVGFREFTSATVTCWPTDPITIIPRRTP